MNLGKRARSAGLLRHFQKPRRPLDSEHFSFDADDLGQVHRRISRPRADVDDARTGGNSGAPPAIGGDRTPDTMLQTEPGDFFIVRPEHVVGFLRHCSLRREGRAKTRTEFRQIILRRHQRDAFGLRIERAIVAFILFAPA